MYSMKKVENGGRIRAVACNGTATAKTRSCGMIFCKHFFVRFTIYSPLQSVSSQSQVDENRAGRIRPKQPVAIFPEDCAGQENAATLSQHLWHADHDNILRSWRFLEAFSNDDSIAQGDDYLEQAHLHISREQANRVQFGIIKI